MNPELLEALQTQYTHERQNGAVYDALAGAFEKMNLAGFAAFMARQGDEERKHAKKFFDYIADLGEQPRVDALNAMGLVSDGSLFVDTLQAFQFALDLERKNLVAMSNVCEVADCATQSFLNPLLDEQIRSIRDLEQYVTQLQLAQGNGAALLFLDHRFAMEIAK